MPTQRFFTRDGALILASIFVNSIPIGYMNVVPLVYLLTIGYSPVTIGVIFAASGVANTIGYTPFGVLADRFGRKRFLILGTALPAAAYSIFALTLNPDLLLVASVIGGVGLAGGLAVAIQSTAVLPLLASSGPEENRTKLFAAFQGMSTVGLSVGSFLSFIPSLLESRLSIGKVAAHSDSFFLMSGIILASAVPLLFVRERRNGEPSAAQTGRRRLGGVTSWSRIARFSLVLGLGGLGFGLVISLLPTWFNLTFGVSESTVGFWTAAAQFLSLAAIFMIPPLVRRYGMVWVIVGSGVVGALVILVMPFSGVFEIAASLFVARSILNLVEAPVIQSYIAGAVPEVERATTYGVVFTAWGFANSVGTIVAGDLFGANFLTLPIVIGGVAYLAGPLIFYAFFRRRRVEEEEAAVPPVSQSLPSR